MNKTWQLHKSGHYFNITINGVNANGIDAEIQIDNDKTVEIDEIKGNIIKFKWYVRIADTSYLGVRFNQQLRKDCFRTIQGIIRLFGMVF